MTDLEKLKAVFDDIRVEYEGEDGNYEEFTGKKYICIEPNTPHPCYFTFKDGKLLDVEIDNND